MRVSKILTAAIFVLIFTAVMGLRDVQAQTPLACEASPVTTGWISMPVSNPSLTDNPDTTVEENAFLYNAGLLGTVENFQGDVIAGLDWLYDDRNPNLETNMVGTQIVSWWTEKNDRNTLLQITNTHTSDTIIGATTGVPGFETGTVTVHVQILGEDCVEIVNFCDVYTPGDVVVYNFSNIVSNGGQVVASGGLSGREGIVTVTPVETCNIAGPLFDAVSWNYLAGNVRIINQDQNWEYGTNARARTATPGVAYFSTDPVQRNFVYDYYSNVQETNCIPDSSCAAQKLFKDFNTIGENAGSDLVLMSFGDYGLCGTSASNGGPSVCNATGKATGNLGTNGVYSPGPLPVPTTFGLFALYDADETPVSCPAVQGCFLRIGIDEGIPSTDDVEPTPPIPTCPFTEEGPVCSDPLCKFTQEGCENTNVEGQEGFCSDGEDNDGVDGADCLDFGCDGEIGDSETGAICETGAETTCNDGFDNDANGFVDCDDLNCILTPVCESGDGGGSGGCTVAAGPVTSGSSAANFLLPLLPLAGVFAVRRIIRRRRK